MSVIDDIAAYIVSNHLGTLPNPATNVVGDLFTDYLPPSPDTVTVLTSLPGRAPLETFKSDAPVWVRPRVQVLCRAKDPRTANDNITAIWKLLRAVAGGTLNGHTYYSIRAIDNPARLGRDDQGRTEYVANFDVDREPY